MKNPLREVFINDLIMLGEAGKKPSGKPVKKPAQQKEKKPPSAKYTTGGRWYTADPEKGGEYVGRYEGPKWINATPQEKAAEKQKAGGTKGYGKDFIGTQGRGIMPQQPSLQTPKPKTKSAERVKKVVAARAKKIFGGENPDSPVPDATLEKAVELLQRVARNTKDVKPGLLTNLLDAINNGDTKSIQR